MAFDANATNFCAANALLLAEASEAAYGTEEAARNLMATQGLTEFQWLDLSGIFEGLHAFTASNEQFTILAFRGTADVKDWMTDLHATPARYSWVFQGAPETGDIHAGFGHALCDRWKDVVNAVDKVMPRRQLQDTNSADPQSTFWITGHSLGGALAALAGSAFTLLPGVIRPVSGIYTFGQPRIGLHNFCNTYDRLLTGVTFRLVNNRDLVPRVPFRGWDYSDIGEMIHFDANGTPRRQSEQWRGFLSRTFESFAEATEIFAHLNMDVGDHSMSKYKQLVAGQQDALARIFT